MKSDNAQLSHIKNKGQFMAYKAPNDLDFGPQVTVKVTTLDLGHAPGVIWCFIGYTLAIAFHI